MALLSTVAAHLLLGTAHAAEPAAEPAGITVPYTRLASGHILVELAVGAGPMVSFAVDTGASVTVLDPSAWAGAGGNPERGLKVRAKGAGGDLQDVRIATGVDITVGGARIDVGAAALLPLDFSAAGGPKLAGLLGRDVLRRYVVELDDAAHELTLHPRGTRIDTGVPMATFAMRKLRAGITSIPVTIGAVPVEAMVDLGASVSILNGPALRLPGVQPEPGCDGAAQGADLATIPVACVRVAGLEIGALELPDVPLYGGELPIFVPLRLDDRPALVLGADLLAGRHIVLDDQHQRLSISISRLSATPGP